MTNIYQKVGTISLYVLMAIGVIIAILFYAGGNVPGTAETGYAEPKITNTALLLSYVYLVIAGILAIVLPLFFKQPAKGKSALYLILGFIVVIAASYLLGSDAPLKDVTISSQAMKFIDGGLIAAYLLIGVAFVGVILSEVSTFFK